MATKKQNQLDESRVKLVLTIIEQLYKDYTANEITEAFRINRLAITQQEEKAALEAQIAELSKSLDNLS